jgi:glycosyltransferase involved in cell wall biosynthesis
MALEVSVVIPTFNRADLLPRTLASILSQTEPPVEVIVVDDGSTDGTEALARSFRPPVKSVRIENSGVCRARNVGASLATAPWIAFCDSDDLWRPDKLAAQGRLLRAVPGLGYAFTNFQVVTGDRWSTATKFDEAPPRFWDLPTRQVEPGAFVIDAPMFGPLIAFQPIFPSTVILSQDRLRRAGGWADHLGRILSEDLEFTLRCVTEPPIGVNAEPLVGIRKHAGNFSGDVLRTLDGEMQILRYVLATHPFAARHAEEIRHNIADRAAAGAELAFLLGDRGQVRHLLASVPLCRRSWRLLLKAAIAELPPPLFRAFQAATVKLAARLRRGVHPESY